MTILQLLFHIALQAISYEKMPGALNPAIDPGDEYDFVCHSPPGDGSKLILHTKGLMLRSLGGKKRTLGKFPLSAGGFHPTYLECFEMPNDYIASYNESNGDDGGAIAKRCRLNLLPCRWQVDVPALLNAPPQLEKHVFKMFTSHGTLELNTETGMIEKFEVPTCLLISRWENGKKIADKIGSRCGEKRAENKK